MAYNKSHSQRKAEQLGMSHGAAAGRLRKRIMFKLLQEAGEDVCYRCNRIIETVDEMSIEHIVPWLNSDNPKELFFDLYNIAFSHLSCNIKSGKRPHKIITPNGMGWCWRCKRFKPLSEFAKEKERNGNGTRKSCKICKQKRNQEYKK